MLRGRAALLGVLMAVFVTAPAHAAPSLDRAFGLGVDTGGALFENCTIASGCQAGDPAGTAGALDDPTAIAVDATGRIVVADREHQRIAIYTVAGDGSVTFNRAFGRGVDSGAAAFENCTTASACQDGSSGAEAGSLSQPSGVAVDASGRIYVTNTALQRVDVFRIENDGGVVFERAFGVGVDTGANAFENCTTASGCQSGTANGSAGALSSPAGLAVDAAGRVVVADRFNNRISRFTVAGDGTVSFDRAFGVGVDTGGAAFENCTTASGCLAAPNSGAAGGLNAPSDVAIDGSGRLVVVDSTANRIARYTVDGGGVVAFDRAFGIGVDTGATAFENCTTASGCQSGGVGGAAGAMNQPAGVAVDRFGGILVADVGNHRIARFAVAGDGSVTVDRAFGVGVATGANAFEGCTATCLAGQASTAAGGMWAPNDVAVDAQGRLLVADRISDRIDRFLPGGRVTVTHALVPASDPGRFALSVANTVVRDTAANGEGGTLLVPEGVGLAVSEAAAPGTDAAQYLSTVDCGASSGPGTSLALTNVAAETNCTVTNTRKRTLTVRSSVSPAGDPGRFTLLVDGAAVPSGSSVTRAHGATPALTVQATAGTNAADYGFAITCDNGQTATAATLQVASLTGDVSCEVAITRRPGTMTPLPQPRPTVPPDSAKPVVGKVSRTSKGFRLTLSETASVRLTVNQLVTGRRSKGRCVKQTKRNRKAKRCTRRVRKGVITKQAGPGTVTVSFTGKIKGRALPAGRYEASVVATDKAGNRSKARTVTFRISRKK